MIWTLLFLVSLVTHSVICDLSAGGGHHHHHGDHSHGDHHDHGDHSHGDHHDHGHGHHGHDHDEHHGHHSDDKKATSGITEHVKKGQLKLPNIKDCNSRVHHTQFNGHGYFFSWEHKATKNLTVNWLTGRNICRRHCMDLVSLETDDEIDFLNARIARAGTKFTWTSGRKCNFDGCERQDLQPISVKGWFWSGSNVRIKAKDDLSGPQGPWSPTGGDSQAQPDNRELRITGKNDEACLAVLNNYYKDGIVWHDIACYHKKPFVCEDSDDLIRFMEQTNPGLAL